MVEDLDRVLDECIDRLNRGESLDVCLADYPEHAEEIRPLLEAVIKARDAYTFTTSADAKMAARRRFANALEGLAPGGRETRPWLSWLTGGARAWATAAIVIVLGLIGFFGLRPVLFPAEIGPEPSPVVVSPEPNPEGNFVFLISDDVNAIADFNSVYTTISKIGLLKDDSQGWIEFEPQIMEVDLALVQGDKTQEIWRGDIPEGEYNNVFIYVDAVHGILKETDEDIEIKLPSSKLHLTKTFNISWDTVTSFTYDLTVVTTGSQQDGSKYILKPQVDESGSSQEARDTRGKKPENRGNNPN